MQKSNAENGMSTEESECTYAWRLLHECSARAPSLTPYSYGHSLSVSEIRYESSIGELLGTDEYSKYVRHCVSGRLESSLDRRRTCPLAAKG